MSIAFQVEVRHKGVYRGRVSPHRVPVIIGASRGADVYLADGSVAGEHAEVVEGPDGMVLVRDLGGPGGVRVNGMRLRNAEVRPGDCISVGNYALVVVEAHQTREIVDAETWVDLPTSTRDTGEPSIEMYVLWNEKVQDVHHFRHKTKKERWASRVNGSFITAVMARKSRASIDVCEPSFTLRDRPGGDLLLPDGFLKKGQTYELIQGKKTGNLLVNIGLAAFEGEVRLRSGQIIDLKTARAQTGGRLTVEQGVRLRIDLGPFTFLIQGTNSGPKPKRFGISRDVATVLLILALSFLGHSGFMIGLQLVPEDGLSLSRTDYQTRHGVVEVLKIAYEAEEPEEPEELEFVKARRVDDDGKGDEDQDSKNKNRNPLVDKLTPEQMRKRNEELAYSSGLSKAMRDQSELIEQALSGIDASGYDSALRALAVSSDESDDRASTNLGLFSGAVGEIGSDGSLGGLPGASTAGGMGGTNGMVAGLGKSDVSGDHVRVRFSNQRRQRALVKTGRLTVRGGYDAGIIRRYIKSKLNELRWCHRQAIQRDPNVAGKITVKFIIQPNGIVPQASIVKSSTTTSAPDLEFCITSKIKFWRFPPPPQAGASAVVTYPFIFKVMR